MIIVCLGLLLASPALHAQDFLQQAKDCLDAGKCDEAKDFYDAYLVEHPQGNAEVKRRIDECGKVQLPTVFTLEPTSITSTSAIYRSYVLDDGGDGRDVLSSRGVCWSTAHQPTLNDNVVDFGTGTEIRFRQITGLKEGTTYYVRAYATNAAGTAYGEEVSFTTKSIDDCGTVTDYDGNVYSTVVIGNQCWMKENLRTTHYADGMAIIDCPGTHWYGADIWDVYEVHPSFIYPDSNFNNVQMYGLLYNYSAAMCRSYSSAKNPSGIQGACPVGWHVPSDAEWKQLEMTVGMNKNEADSLGWRGKIAAKLSGNEGWKFFSEENTAGNRHSSERNITGFSALPACGPFGYSSAFWSTSDGSADSGHIVYAEGEVLVGDTCEIIVDGEPRTVLYCGRPHREGDPCAYYRKLFYTQEGVERGVAIVDEHLSVRCLRDESSSTSQQPASTPANKEFPVNGIAFNMIYVEGGTFTMGCTGEQGSDCDGYERPAHKVTLSSFYMGEAEVTQGLWRAVMGDEPYSEAWREDEYGRGISYPAYWVSWDDCQEFVRKLNRLASDQLPAGWHFALPTEAQWEFAARGGNQSQGYKYSGSGNINDVAWFYDNSFAKGSSSPDYGTHPVKRKQPNALGLYDMSGNVWEWCKDVYDEAYYEVSPSSNPQGPAATEDSYRVLRGGSWDNSSRCCRVSYRMHFLPDYRDYSYDYGFRLALVPDLSCVDWNVDLDIETGTDLVEVEDPVLLVPQIRATFPGGMDSLQRFLAVNIQYPQAARDAGWTGTVLVEFVVEKDGSIQQVNVIKSVCPALDEEAVRVVKSMPKWTAGKNDGQPCRSFFQLPITFTLQ